MITAKKLAIPDLFVIEPSEFNDERGCFFESYNQKDFNSAINREVTFVQDNHSISAKGVLRGLHFQQAPYEQAKLVRVISGEVWDVAVDIREKSPTYGQWEGIILSAENKKQFWIPEGFAHGFYVLSERAELVYKVNQFYSKSHEGSVHWSNNPFNIKWPIEDDQVLLSEKDENC